MKKYTPEIKSFIAKNVKGTATKALAALVNEKFGTDFTESKMKSYKTNYKLKSGTPTSRPAGLPTELYPEEVQEFIKGNYAGVGWNAMAELLNRTFGTNYTSAQIGTYYGNRNLDSGLKGYFPKGHVPANKGKKGICTGGVQTQFKKGNKSANWVPIGSERINADGYTEIKIQDGKLQKNWRGKHIIVWEKVNGPLPKGHVVIFGDRNNCNFDINNLLLVSRGQLATLNQKGLIQKNADLTRSAIIMTDIYHKISERNKAIKN